MRIKNMHIQGFDDSGPVCGAAGRVWSGPNWNDTDNDPGFKRCARCEKKLGKGGLERLEQAREERATVRAAHRAGKDDAEKKAPSRVEPTHDDTGRTARDRTGRGLRPRAPSRASRARQAAHRQNP